MVLSAKQFEAISSEPRTGLEVLFVISPAECAVEWLDDMAWMVPAYKPHEIDAAGAALIKPSPTLAELDKALEVINNWRSSHSFPLNTLQVGLRRNARQIDTKAVVAQRLKRLSSIQVKLRRFNWLTLSVMQDIGGCRAVVSSVRRVDELVQLYKKGDLRVLPQARSRHGLLPRLGMGNRDFGCTTSCSVTEILM